jgi:hypothetical protein
VNKTLGLAEGARFELAVHGVDAGFQDRWFQPLTHPSDNVFSDLRDSRLFCFINSSINLTGPRGIGNVGRLEIDIPLVHPHAAVAAGLRRHVYSDPLPSSLGQRGLSQVVENKLFDARRFERLLYLGVNMVLGDPCAIVQGEHEPVQVRHDGAAFLVGIDLLVNFSRPTNQRRDLLDFGFLPQA